MRAALLVTGLLLCVAGRAGAEEIADQQVARGVERGVAWLRNQQSGDGSWGGLKVAKGLYRYPSGPNPRRPPLWLLNGWSTARTVRGEEAELRSGAMSYSTR